MKAKKKQKRQQQWLVIIGYTLAVIFIALLTALLVAYGRGYSYNFQTHKVVRSGLLIVGTKPGGASVSVNGKYQHTSPARVTLGTGSYKVSVTEAGYRDWYKVVQIVASEVTFAQYIVMIPVHLATHAVASSPAALIPAQSADRQWLAYASDSASDDLAIVNTGGGNAHKIWQASAPTGNPTAPAGQITAVSWSDDDSHLLVSTISAGQTTSWMVAANGSGATDVSDSYGVTSGQLIFAPGGWQKLDWNSPGGLRVVNLASQSVTGVLASNVVQMTTSNGLLYYVQQTPLGRQLISLDGSGHKQTVAAAVATSDSYSIDAEDFGGHNYVAMVPSQTHTATIYIDPASGQPSTLVISQAADTALFSPDGRYLLAGGAAGGTVYDIYRSNSTGHVVLYGLGGLSANPQDFVWLDNYHLLYRTGGQSAICEFDGGNNTVLGPSLSPIWPAPDGKSFDNLQTTGSLIKILNTAI